MAAALRNPTGLAMLALSVLLALALATQPALERWAPRSPLVLALGLLAYLATAAIYAWPRGEAPELREVKRIRDSLAARLSQRRAAEARDGRADVTRALEDAVKRFDDELIPALTQIVERHRVLGEYLARFQRRGAPRPEPDVLDRLTTIYRRQADAITAAVQQAINADAMLLALINESTDEATVATEAKNLSNDLVALHDSLRAVLSGDEEWERLVDRHARRRTMAE